MHNIYKYIYTLNSAFNKKKYADILLCYRWLFVKSDVFIGEWGIFGAKVFLLYSQYFIKGDFIIGRVESIKCLTFFRCLWCF